jgi:hypothetical protein
VFPRPIAVLPKVMLPLAEKLGIVPLVIVTLAKVKLPRLVTVDPSVTTVLPIVALELLDSYLEKSLQQK